MTHTIASLFVVPATTTYRMAASNAHSQVAFLCSVRQSAVEEDGQRPILAFSSLLL